MTNILLISIIEAIYVVYVMNYFKTRYSIAHPVTYFNTAYMFHPIGVSDKPRSNICPFGHDISWVIAAALLMRGIILHYKIVNTVMVRKLTKIGIILLFIGSLMNFNCVAYLLPIFIVEWQLTS
jgi:hypothetical protein